MRAKGRESSVSPPRPKRAERKRCEKTADVTSHRAGAPGSSSHWAVSRAFRAPPTCPRRRRSLPEYTPSRHLATGPKSSCQQVEVACPWSDGLYTAALSTINLVPYARARYAVDPLIFTRRHLMTANTKAKRIHARTHTHAYEGRPEAGRAGTRL